MTQNIKQLLSTSTTFKYKAQDFLEIQHPAITMPGSHKKLSTMQKIRKIQPILGRKNVNQSKLTQI